MPLTKKGAEIERNMESEYGKKKGKSVFYASKNAGTISGVDRAKRAQDMAGRLAAGERVRGRDRKI